MKSYNIDVGKFIRDAISEKIKREYNDLIPKKEKMNEQLKKELLEYLIKLVTEKRLSKFLTTKAESLIKQIEE